MRRGAHPEARQHAVGRAGVLRNGGPGKRDSIVIRSKFGSGWPWPGSGSARSIRHVCKSIHPDPFWSPDGLGPDLAARAKAERLFQVVGTKKDGGHIWFGAKFQEN